MTADLSTALLRLPRRAETSGRDKLIQTFVDVGPLFALLRSPDHQVLFGRRGTGKTHALSYLADDREKAGDVVALTDLRSVGSSSGLYADETVPTAERATRLLVDTLNSIHDALFDFVVTHADALNLAVAGPALDALANAITEVKVVGSVEHEAHVQTEAERRVSGGVKVSITAAMPAVDLSAEGAATRSLLDSRVVRRSGQERFYVNFGATGSAFRALTQILKGRRLWILLDEWSSVPPTLQPYLADLIRRSLLPVPSTTVKIAAIEQRSIFRARVADDYVGLELGADVAADVNLDDFMVFDNDAHRAKEFFQNLIAQHVRAAMAELEPSLETPPRAQDLMRLIFTEKRAIEEFVRACEGVPRDAINILALAAQRAAAERISVQHVRIAARNWYQRDKEKAASANERAHQLLHWIIDQVIGRRRARAFLLRSESKEPLIDALYDARVLHVLKRAISTHDQPGVRYDVYKLDYGCYVDLMTTAKAPLGLLPVGEEEGSDGAYMDVPPDDYRSIRRAILDVRLFDS